MFRHSQSAAFTTLITFATKVIDLQSKHYIYFSTPIGNLEWKNICCVLTEDLLYFMSLQTQWDVFYQANDILQKVTYYNDSYHAFLTLLCLFSLINQNILLRNDFLESSQTLFFNEF